MLKFSQLILGFFVFYLKLRCVKTQGHLGSPADPPWRNWAEDIINVHLTNMTAELLRDMKLKLEQSKTIQSKYMYTMTYDLGTIAASIQERFKHMLEIYRSVANLDSFATKRYSMDQVLDSYHIIQGDYNMIRFERNMFFQSMEKHIALREERRKKIRILSGSGDGRQHPNEDKLLKIMEQTGGKGRRAGSDYEALNKTKLLSDLVNDSKAQDDAAVEWVARRRTEDGARLPGQARRASTAKRFWKQRVNWFPEDTRLHD